MTASRALIGLSVGTVLQHTGLPYYGLNPRYVRALRQAGADVVLIPAGEPDTVPALIGRLDGVVFPGGLDVHPRHYGEEPSPALGGVNEDLDALELPLVREAVGRGLPVLGICRGHQMVNVALGGTLYQDIAGDGVSLREHFSPVERGRDHLAHRVEVLAGTLLERVVGPGAREVNSFHHQSIKRPAPGLRVNAIADDGVIEGLESEDGRLLSLQCHPEELAPAHAWARALFAAFVAAAATGAPIGAAGRPVGGQARTATA